jgi:2-dehydro-3-deoxy-D-gluconate 5-dehydrogenase
VNFFSLNNKNVLITGGASGIGQALAVGLAQAGARVAITTNRQSGAKTQAMLPAGSDFLEVPGDLAQPGSAIKVVQAVEAKFGQIDVLVNNAGIIRREAAQNHSIKDFEQVLEVNLLAVWQLSQACARGMLSRKQGKIINIASLLSFQGGVRVPGYTASKHAVVGLTKALANEWASHGVNVNAVAPGYIETDNTAALRADPERQRQILERIPAGRWGQASDLVGATVFLASHASDYVHGHVLVVDGGWMAR